MAAVMEERAFGDVVLKADEVTVTFGAVKALTGVSFEVRGEKFWLSLDLTAPVRQRCLM